MASELREGQARILDAMAADQRRRANIEGPRDYVPTPQELALERAPMLMVADALEAGAAALRGKP